MRIKKKNRAVRGITNKRISTRLSSSRLKNYQKTRKRSSLELRVYDWLKELNIPFVKEKTIGRCHVDILLNEKDVIELNGCYYHSCKECFPIPSNELQKLAPLKDAKRYNFIKSKGYTIHIIWEHEVDNYPESVKTKLKEIYNLGKLKNKVDKLND